MMEVETSVVAGSKFMQRAVNISLKRKRPRKTADINHRVEICLAVGSFRFAICVWGDDVYFGGGGGEKSLEGHR